MKASKRKALFLTAAYSLFFGGIGTLYYNVKVADRYPAAIPSLDTEIQGQQVNDSLLASSSFELSNDVYTLSLKAMGQACDAYDRYSFEFITPNVHTSGEVPKLVIDGACVKTEGTILNVRIPFKKIMSENPGEIDLFIQKPQAIKVKVRNVIGFWPEYWVLSKVRLINSDTEAALEISEKEVSKLTNNSLSMHWK